MKKIRYIPYGYTMRDGRTVVESEEAEIIRNIFEGYIKGASLKEIAEELTRRKIPYTEKTTTWDKARIARIIENVRYTGSEEYDPIIDENIYDEAMRAKTARQRNCIPAENEAIRILRNRVRCAECGSAMERRVCSKRKIKESWTCSNPACGIRVRISDTDLLARLTGIINRIIQNADLVLPHEKKKYSDPPGVLRLQQEIDAEMESTCPSEELIIMKVQDIANELYRESQAPKQIAARIARQRVKMMQPTEQFSSENFIELADNVLIDANGALSVITKTENQINEIKENDDGSPENT